MHADVGFSRRGCPGLELRLGVSATKYMKAGLTLEFLRATRW